VARTRETGCRPLWPLRTDEVLDRYLKGAGDRNKLPDGDPVDCGLVFSHLLTGDAEYGGQVRSGSPDRESRDTDAPSNGRVVFGSATAHGYCPIGGKDGVDARRRAVTPPSSLSNAGGLKRVYS
jgi:hypothetical protein